MIREAISKSNLFDTNKDRTPLVRANAFTVFVNGDERFKFTGRKGKFWRKSMYYFPNGPQRPETAYWEKPKKDVETTWNAAEIVDYLIEQGYEVTDVKID